MVRFDTNPLSSSGLIHLPIGLPMYNPNWYKDGHFWDRFAGWFNLYVAILMMVEDHWEIATIPLLFTVTNLLVHQPKPSYV